MQKPARPVHAATLIDSDRDRALQGRGHRRGILRRRWTVRTALRLPQPRAVRRLQKVGIADGQYAKTMGAARASVPSLRWDRGGRVTLQSLTAASPSSVNMAGAEELYTEWRR